LQPVHQRRLLFVVLVAGLLFTNITSGERVVTEDTLT